MTLGDCSVGGGFVENVREGSDPDLAYRYEIGLTVPSAAAVEQAPATEPATEPPTEPETARETASETAPATEPETARETAPGTEPEKGPEKAPQAEKAPEPVADDVPRPADGRVTLGPESVDALGLGIGEQIRALARRVSEQLSRPAGTPHRQAFIVDTVDLSFGISVRAGEGNVLAVVVDPAGETNVAVTVTLKHAPELVRSPSRPVFS